MIYMRWVAIITLIFVFGAMLLSLASFSMAGDLTGKADCPFMSHTETLCLIDVADHLSAWKGAFASATPTLVLLLTSLMAGALWPAAERPRMVLLTRSIMSFWRQWQMRSCQFLRHTLQRLYARGILNPKVF